jgi:diguanylate cyclase (GGDEF)-like protein
VHRLAAAQRGALLFMDLDYFKDLNDTQGHMVGDLLLQQVAERLRFNLREGDTAARLGGDEFVVLLEGLPQDLTVTIEQVQKIAQKIRNLLNQPYQLDDLVYSISASIGVMLFVGSDEKADELLKQADIAMYQAKSQGRNAIRFFDPQMQQEINAREAMKHALQNAISANEFELFYQMQVDSHRKTTGAEALIRWYKPEEGLVEPVAFIPIAEETGLILPIGEWVVNTAFAQLQAWKKDPLMSSLVLSINVSAKQFAQVNFVDQIQASILRFEVNPALVKIELTESLLLDNLDDVIDKMNRLHAMGIRFSLDDFGTGYSSLQYLKRLPFDQLKIDQAFVRDIELDKNDRAIVKTVIGVGYGLEMEVIAEGVETQAQRAFLYDNGCLHYQGYLFSKPVPIAEFEAQFLLNNKTETL